MKKGLILSLICITLLCGCGKIPKLQNGEEAVVTFKKDDNEHQISAEELYTELKANFGLEATLKLIDTYVLETEFSGYIDEAKKNAENYVKAYIEAYGGEDKFLSALQQNTNYTDIDAYKDYLYVSFMQSHALEEYAKKQVTEKEIKDYYDKDAKEDVEVYQILVTPEVKDNMTATEKKEAENKAKEKAKDIIKKLNEAEDKLATFKELVKEYSEDESTKDSDGNMGYINYNDLGKEYDEFLDTIYKLKNGEYSKEVITTEAGYHVVYRNASREKNSLDDMKDKIIETLANEKITKDSEMSLKSMKYYRELYNMKIIDSTLDRQYGIYLNNLANSNTNK